MEEIVVLWNTVKNMLMRNTGSTTVLLEAITEGSLMVKVVRQEQVLSNSVQKWHGDTICRESVLSIEGIDVSHNIVFINWEELGSEVRDALQNGEEPIGKLIMNTDHRRKIIYSGNMNQTLRDECNINEPCNNNVLKKYEIWKEDVCLFIIYEVYYMESLKQCVNQRERGIE